MAEVDGNFAAEAVGRGTEERDDAPWLDFRSIVDSLADAVVAVDYDNRILYVNSAAEALLGWPHDSLEGRDLAVIQPPRFRVAHRAAFARYIATETSQIVGHSIRVAALRRDGSEVDVELRVTSMRMPHGELVLVGTLRDLGERVELERQLSVTRYLRASTEAAARLNSLLDFDAVLQVVVDTLIAEFEVALARIWLADPSSRSLYLRAEGGPMMPPGVTEGNVVHYAALPIWIEAVARSREPFVQNGLEGDNRFEGAWVAAERVGGVAAFPLSVGSDVEGVLVCFFHEPVLPEVVDVLGSFAAIVSASLNDVQLYVREQEARTDAERAQQEFAFLAEVSRVIAASRDPERTMRAVARLAVPFLADWCVVDMLQDDATLRRVALVHSDPERERRARDYLIRYSAGEPYVQTVLQSGEPQLVRDVTDTFLRSVARDEEQFAILRASGIHSLMCVPLVIHGLTRGVLSFVRLETGSPYTGRDLELAEDVARRVAIAVDSAYLYRELQDAIRLRDEFLSTVSHDLKNPIAAVKGRAQMLARRLARLPVEDRERFETGLLNIDANATRMTRFINDLVDITRLRIGQPLDLAREPVDLVELARGVAAEQQLTTDRHTISVGCGSAAVPIQGDPNRLERVLANLISNAIKYSPDGGPITVTVAEGERAGQSVATVTVQDRGVGIPANELPRIFERYFRASNVRDKMAGSGIGLAGAAQIVEQHGGSLRAESVEGAGSTFIAEFPLPQPAGD